MCGREVNSQLHGDTCPDCQHENCSVCGLLQWPEPVLDSDDEAPPQISALPRAFLNRSGDEGNHNLPNATLHLRANRRRLPVLLNGFLVQEIYAGSGSEESCISKKLVRKIGGVIETNFTTFTLPLTGRKFQSLS